MKRWKNFLWISIGLLVLIALAGSIVPPAVAQIRAALVRDLDTPVRGERFLQRVSGNFDSGSFSETVQIQLIIPPGKKLFIQSFDLHVLLTDNQGIMEAALRISNSDLYRYWVDLNSQAAGSTQRHFTGKVDINTAIVAGDSLSLFVFRNDNLGSSSLNFFNGTITGYLVDQNP